MLLIHNCKTRSKFFCKLSVMSDRDQCFAGTVKILKECQQHILRLFIQPGKRLVKNQHLGI